MCEKCKDIDQKIERFRELSRSITDQPTIDRFNEAIGSLIDQKLRPAYHASGPKSKAAVGGSFLLSDATVGRFPPSTRKPQRLVGEGGRAHFGGMGTKSSGSIYGASVRAAAERAAEARKAADRLACEAWIKLMLGFEGPAQPSPALGDAVNAGYLYLEVKCLGCNTLKTVLMFRRRLACHRSLKK